MNMIIIYKTNGFVNGNFLHEHLKQKRAMFFVENGSDTKTASSVQFTFVHTQVYCTIINVVTTSVYLNCQLLTKPYTLIMGSAMPCQQLKGHS